MKLAIYSPVMSDEQWAVGSFRTEELCRALSSVGVEGVVASPFLSGARRIAPLFDAVPLPLNPIRRLKSFTELVRKGDFDLIQERPLSKGVTWNGCGLSASMVTGLPFVLEIHNIGTLQNMVKRLPLLVTSLWWSDLVLSYSDASGIPFMMADKSKIVYVPNGYSSELVASVAGRENDLINLDEATSGRKAFGFFGGLCYEKGVDVVLQTAELLSENEEICFLFAGKGPLESRIKEVSKQRNSNVVFLGLLNRQQALACMSQCSATFALYGSSQSLAGNPVKIVESLALGVTPIISEDIVMPVKLKEQCVRLPNQSPRIVAEAVIKLANSIDDKNAPHDLEDCSIERIAQDIILPAYRRLTHQRADVMNG